MKARLASIVALFSVFCAHAATVVSPEGTSNVRILLARLAQQADELSVVHEANQSIIEVLETDLTTVDGKIDTIDGIVDTINANVSTLDNKVDTIDGIVDTINTNVTTVDGKVDTIDGVVDTINTNVSTVDTVVDGIASDMATNFAGTWTAIDAISGGSCDLAEVQTDIAETWTILATVESKIDTVDTVVDGIASDMATKFAETWTAVEAITPAIQLSNADASGGTITISSSGTYEVTEDLTNKISITTSNVDLNLNGFTISLSGGSDDFIAIGNSLEKITICNGTIKKTSDLGSSGIFLDNSCTEIYIDNVKIYGCQKGIELNGTIGSEVTGCKISNCSFVQNSYGVWLSYANANVIENCIATLCTTAGFYVSFSEANYLYHCQAINSSGSSIETTGFIALSGEGNLFENCVAQKTETSATSFGSFAAGFSIAASEQNTQIIQSIAQNTQVSASGDTVAYGMMFYPIILQTSGLLVEVATDNTPTSTVLDVHWSPDERYIATVDAGNEIRVFGFDGSTLHHIDNLSSTGVKTIKWAPDGITLAVGNSTSVDVYEYSSFGISSNCSYSGPGTQVNSLAWSPDGAHLAVGYDSGNLRVVGFTGTALVQIATDSTMEVINDLDWSPCGNYIACAGTAESEGDDGVVVFAFDQINLTYKDDYTEVAPLANYVAWSPIGKYIAYGKNDGTIRVLSFNGTTLSSAATATGPGTPTNADVDWSPRGKYLIAGYPGTSSGLRVYSFTGSSLGTEDTEITSMNYYTTSWSPSGKYIASADASASGNILRVYDAMNTPENCLLDGNTIANTISTGQVAGIGILGGGNNQFTQNISSDNTRNYSYGIPNTYCGLHSIQQPFDNISLPVTQ